MSAAPEENDFSSLIRENKELHELVSSLKGELQELRSFGYLRTEVTDLRSRLKPFGFIEDDKGNTLIGFQLTDNKGEEVLPDLTVQTLSECLSQWWQQDNKLAWTVVPVYDGDIPEPIFSKSLT